MNSLEPMCQRHEDWLGEIKDSVAVIRESQATMTEALAGLRREMDAGFKGMHKRQDLTNGRVTTLEAEKGRMQVNIAAQEAFTPGLFKTIDEVKNDLCQKDRDLWNAVNELRRGDRELAVKDAKKDGFFGGVARAGVIAWTVVVAIFAGAAWLITLILQSISRAETPK